MTTPYPTVRQSRSNEPSPYEQRLAATIEEIFSTGSHDLDDLLTGLEKRGMTGPDGRPFTETTLRAELTRLETS